MNHILQDTVRSLKGSGRGGARKLLWPVLLALAACLFGFAGLGFLTMSIYLALSTAFGAGLTTMVIGIGYTVLAGALFFAALKKRSKPILTDTVKTPPEASSANVLSLAAFTAAYVLARQFSETDRD